MKPLVRGQPLLNVAMRVRGVVVGNQMQRDPCGSLLIDLLEKLQPFLMPVFVRQHRHDLAFQIIERGKQRHRAMPNRVMGGGLDMPHAQWEAGLGALDRLALTLFVAAEDQRPIRRIQVQADHIPELFVEPRIVGDLEGPCQVRLDVVL